MRIDKCDVCNKILDKKVDVVYSVCEITKHIPDSLYSRLVINRNDTSENVSQIEESWVNYLDLDFCESCWELASIKKYIK